MKLQNPRYLCIAFLLASAFVGMMHAQTINYTTFPVPEAAPATAGSLGVQAINNSGVVVGYLYDTSANLEGWVRDASGNITLLVDPLDTSIPTATVAYGIDNAGVIGGYFYDTSAELYYGYAYDNGTYTTYIVPNQPAGTDSSINGILNSKQFCGFVLQPPYTDYQAFVSIDGVVTVFGVTGSNDTVCYAINASNEAVGSYTDSAGVEHGFLRDPSTGDITTINVPGASTTLGTVPCVGSVAGSTGNGINNAGYISGHYYDTSNNEHGYVLTPKGKFIKLNVPGAYQTGGGGISNANEMVGHWSDSSCNNSGYIASSAKGDWK